MEAQMTRVAVEERIRERVNYRRFYRTYRFAAFAELETENTLVLRELLAIRSTVRRAARRAEIQHEAWNRQQVAR